LTYDYGAFGNKLLSVEDASQDTSTFHNRNAGGQDYWHDKNGSMTKDLNKQIDSIYYNHLNLPMKIMFANNDSILYFYDAAGIKLRQEVYKAGTLETKRDYAGEFFYENGELKFAHHEEGRVVFAEAEAQYEFHLKDHLGNVRLTFGTVPESYTITETFETGEENGFDNLHRHVNANANTTLGGNEVERLQIGEVGAMVMLSVNRGDTVSLSVKANYETAPGGNNLAATSFALLFSAFDNSMYGTGEGSGGYLEGQFEDALSGVNMAAKGDASTSPRAYLNYIYFDKEMNYLTAGFSQITTAAEGIGMHELVSIDPIYAQIDGYILAYLSNENQQPVDVHFDDFKIVHSKTNVVSAQSYYAFGGHFSGFTRTASEPQRFLYNAKEWQEDLGLNLQDFGRRMRDPWGGPGFISQDRFAEKYYSNSPYHFALNNPILFLDFNGDSTIYYNYNGDVLHVSHDQMENAVVVISDDQLEGFNEYLTQIMNDPNGVGWDADGSLENWALRSYGESYMIDGFKDFYSTNHDQQNSSDAEHASFLYEKDGVVRIGNENFTQNKADEVTWGKAEGKNPAGKIHTHASPLIKEEPSKHDRQFHKNRIYNVVIGPDNIYLYGKNEIRSVNGQFPANIVVPKKNTFLKK
jgi:RHS repeat-associated protein